MLRRVGRTQTLGTLVALFALLTGFAPAAHTEETEGVATEAAPVADEVVHGDGRRTLRRLPVNLGRSIVGVFHADNVVPLLAGSTAAATASLFDQDVRDSLQADTLNWGDTLETGAGPVWSTVFVAGMFTALVAGLVGASRLEQDKHYLSDVVAGATLGYIVGRTVVRLNSRPLEGGSARSAELNLAPIVSRHTRGLRLSVVF
jgi:hypothetical protein